MKLTLKTILMLLLATTAIVGCSTPPKDPYNSPDSQRDRHRQTQDELSTETSR